MLSLYMYCMDYLIRRQEEVLSLTGHAAARRDLIAIESQASAAGTSDRIAVLTTPPHCRSTIAMIC